MCFFFKLLYSRGCWSLFEVNLSDSGYSGLAERNEVQLIVMALCDKIISFLGGYFVKSSETSLTIIWPSLQ